MQISIADNIVAAITLNKNDVGGSIPIFFAKDEAEQTRIAMVLSNIVKGTVHDLENGTFLIVRH